MHYLLAYHLILLVMLPFLLLALLITEWERKYPRQLLSITVIVVCFLLVSSLVRVMVGITHRDLKVIEVVWLAGSIAFVFLLFEKMKRLRSPSADE